MATYSSIRYNMGLSSSTTGGGSLKLISTQTASSDNTIQFTSGIDSTYKKYIIKYIDVHPATDSQHFRVNFRDGSTDYDATKTTTYFEAEHGEDGSGGGVAYNTSNDLAQSTGVQILAGNVGADNDQSCSGELCILNPASTTFATCFYATTNSARSDNITFNIYVDGYCSAAAAIDGVQFSFASGAIASGTFKLYGVA